MSGWRLTGIVSLLLAAMTLAFLAAQPDIDGLRQVIRATARTSLVLFATAFSAAALAQLMPNGITRWQRRNRRYLGVSFAVSHFIHLGALVVLARIDANLFWTLTNLTTIALAGTAYLFLAAMTATSFDRTAAWIGPRAWRLLHLIGGWYIWISFAVAVAKRLGQGPLYWSMMALLIAVAVARLIAMARRSKVAMAAP
ncbi:MAG TPA: hypothetical protein VEC60_13830 [Reyranella sp.]|nr:hypothetical protein [Reyranella sp.]